MTTPLNLRASWIPASGDIMLTVNVGDVDVHVAVRLTPAEAAELTDQLQAAVDASEGHHTP